MKKENEKIKFVIREWLTDLWNDYVDLDATDILLLARIEFFHVNGETNECRLTDETLSSELHVCERSVRSRIQKLVKLGLIEKTTITLKGKMGLGRIRTMSLSKKTMDYISGKIQKNKTTGIKLPYKRRI